VWKEQHDDRMLSSLGFEKIMQPAIDDTHDLDGATTFRGDIDYVARHDREALRAMRDDIRNWSRKGEPFATAYFPQLSHDPWRVLDGQPANSDSWTRGRRLAAEQDRWLGELMDELEQNHALDKTIVVVTSDHGVRMFPETAASSRRPKVQVPLDDDAVHVPLLVYVPGAVQHTIKISAPTSHIDITPTVLDLLGVTAARGFEQGTAIWNSEITDRRIHTQAVGVTELIQGGKYYLRTNSNTIYAGSSPAFTDGDIIPFHSAQAADVRKTVDEQARIQRALLFHVFGNPSVY
jgi:membrane-anchored protein YejM (alkaline phosphatase superfamily)